MEKQKPVNVRVSIVEDDAPSREIFSDWLSHADGIEFVSAFGNAENCAAAIPTQRPDVILMDIKLPGMSGIDCVRRLKPQMPQSQFVMLTVYEDSQHIFEAVMAGATGYLLKQTLREELVAAIKYVHSGGSPMSSYLARKVVQYFPSTPSPEAGDMDLSPRESEVVHLLAQGYLYKEIAEKLKISVRTVDTYIRRIYEKLQVRSRGQAVAKFAHLSSPDSRSHPFSRV